MKFTKTKQGFSLLEVMIALAVVSMLSFGILQLVLTNLRATKSAEMTVSLDNVIMEVSSALKDPAVCQSNLSNFATTTLPSPLDGSSINLKQVTLPSTTVPLVGNNGSLANQPNTKVSLSIGNIKKVSTTSYLANINFSLDKGDGSIGARNIVRTLPMSLTSTVAGGPITGCSTFGPSTGGPSPTASTPPSSPAQICALLGLPFDSTTNQCAGGPVATLSQVCASLGGTYNASNQTCTGVNLPTTGGSGSSGGPGCVASTTSCGGESLNVPALADKGTFNKQWYILNINAICTVNVTCSGAAWSQLSCVCE